MLGEGETVTAVHLKRVEEFVLKPLASTIMSALMMPSAVSKPSGTIERTFWSVRVKFEACRLSR